MVLCILEVPEVMHCVLFCMLEAAEGGLYLLETEILEAMEVMRRMLLCIAGGARGAGGDASCAALYAGGDGG